MLRRRLPFLIVGGAAFLMPLMTWGLPSLPVRAALREWPLDMMLRMLPLRKGIGPDVVIVDIDPAALARFGPWPRARLGATP